MFCGYEVEGVLWDWDFVGTRVKKIVLSSYYLCVLEKNESKMNGCEWIV